MFQLNLDLNRDFKMEERFYQMSYGWANRYIFVQWKENVSEKSPPFIDEVKKGRGIYRVYSGTTPGDIIGNGTVLNIFSENLFKLLQREKVILKKWSIKIIIDEKT